MILKLIICKWFVKDSIYYCPHFCFKCKYNKQCKDDLNKLR